MILSIDISWLFSPKDYFYAIISAVIGAVLGIRWAKFQYDKQKTAHFLKIHNCIVDSLKFNKDRSLQAVGQLNKEGMPNYPLDGARLSSLIIEAHGHLSDELIRKLDWHRYQLDHITAKLSVINSFFLSSSVNTPETEKVYDIWIKMLRESLIEHYKQIIDATPLLLSEMRGMEQGIGPKA